MDATCGVEVWLDSDGRLRDAKNDFVFTDKVFSDSVEANDWLLNDMFARFVGAYMAKKSDSPSLDVMSFYDVEPTLDSWLEMNEVTDTFDAELLECVPVVFRDEYEERLRLHSEYETKWQRQRRSK
jgi:hypothetical protein